MWNFLLRLVWRAVIFVLGIYLVYATIFLAFPYLNDELPLAVALLILYCLLAYAAIPALFRLWRIVFKPNHIPMYATTADGWPSDPVNIAVIANSKRHLIKSMRRAGWYTADKATLKNKLHEGYAILFNKPYPTAPFSTLYLFDRPFDVGFQIPRGPSFSPRSRHHVRFWRLQLPEGDRHREHYHFWHKHLRHLFGADKQVWIGAAIDDTHPIGLRWRDGRLTHRTDTNTDKERDFIIKTLREAAQSKEVTKIQAGEPFRFRGQQLHNNFICDGSIRVARLRNPLFGKLLTSKKPPRT